VAGGAAARGAIHGFVLVMMVAAPLRRVYRDELHLLGKELRRQGGQAGFG